MAEAKFLGIIRRIDFEPKKDFLAYRTYAHVFLQDKPGGAEQIDVYTEDPRFEAAFLANYVPTAAQPPKVEVHYEDVDGVKKVFRVTMDREFTPK